MLSCSSIALSKSFDERAHRPLATVARTYRGHARTVVITAPPIARSWSRSAR